MTGHFFAALEMEVEWGVVRGLKDGSLVFAVHSDEGENFFF